MIGRRAPGAGVPRGAGLGADGADGSRVGGVSGGTEIAATGAAGVGVRGGGSGDAGTTGAGAAGVGRSGGSDAPSAGNGAAGVGTRGAAGGVGTLGAAGGVTRWEAIGVTGRDAAAGVCLFCGGTNGPGGVRRGANASPIGSTGVGRRGGCVAAIPTGLTPPQAEQRARTPPSGTFAGSTLKTVEHCGQLTFITGLHSRFFLRCLPRTAAACHLFFCRSNKPSR